MTLDSLLLSDDWDLTLTAGGNLAVTRSTKERIAQDVASYERTFRGEPWYAVTDGVPYLTGELAELPPAALVRERAIQRALQVPGVASVQVTLTEFKARVLRGSIRVGTRQGETFDVTI